MNIAQLRKDLPDWTWRAERYGMGWRYIGSPASDPKSECTVYAVSVLCGPGEDSCETQWRVSTPYAPYTLTYSEFWMQVKDV